MNALCEENIIYVSNCPSTLRDMDTGQTNSKGDPLKIITKSN